MELKYANEDKIFDEGCWILDYKYLSDIAEKLNGTDYGTDLETIEAILLIANGEYELWKESIKELESYGEEVELVKIYEEYIFKDKDYGVCKNCKESFEYTKSNADSFLDYCDTDCEKEYLVGVLESCLSKGGNKYEG